MAGFTDIRLETRKISEQIKKEVNVFMMNMHNSKTKKMLCAIIVVILIVAMVAPMALRLL